MTSPRETYRQAKAAVALAQQLHRASTIDTDDYWLYHGFVRIDQANAAMAAKPVDTLEAVVDNPELLGALKAAGVLTILDVMGGPRRRIPNVPGVDRETYAEVASAATAAWNAFLTATDVEFTPDTRSDNQTRVLEMLSHLVEVNRASSDLKEPILEFASLAEPLLKTALPAANPVIGLFAGPVRRARAVAAIATLETHLAPLMLRDIPTLLTHILKDLKVKKLEGDALWNDLRAHSKEYDVAMDQIGRPDLR
ncbi:MAG: hypothetical protein JW722_02550 [Demequinaceae bacterium]|nr:hypothetical protein [Demequinaceae bacterium]